MDSVNKILTLPTVNSKPVRTESSKAPQSEEAPSMGSVSGNVPESNQAKDLPDSEHVAAAVKDMNEYLQAEERSLQFSIDRDSGRMVVQIKDLKTNEVIRQIPPEDVIRLTKQLDRFKGMLFEEIA